MSNGGMAAYTLDVFPAVDPDDGGGQFRMAPLARALGHPVVVALDLDVIGKSPGGECE